MPDEQASERDTSSTHVSANGFEEIKAHTDKWLSPLRAKIDKCRGQGPTRALALWRKSHWSALIGIGILLAAMVVRRHSRDRAVFLAWTVAC